MLIVHVCLSICGVCACTFLEAGKGTREGHCLPVPVRHGLSDPQLGWKPGNPSRPPAPLKAGVQALGGCLACCVGAGSQIPVLMIAEQESLTDEPFLQPSFLPKK